MLRNILLATIAAASLVHADVCTDKSRTLENTADLLALAGCKTINGDVIIGPALTTAEIPSGVTQILGNLIAVNDVALQSLSAPTLTKIGGTFNLTSLTVLATLSFPKLTSVGTIYWQTLPLLNNLAGWVGVTDADYVTITDTYLESLAGINLVSVATFDINNNGQLKDVTVQLTHITDSLHIEFNAASVSASFPNLTWANNATFRSCSAVALPVLATVNGSLGFFENSLTDLSAPMLTQVGTNKGDITFAKNLQLTNVTMPKLTTIGGTLQFVNNSAIEEITGFPKLTTVSGSIDISGEFDEAAFPLIHDIRGGLNVQTTGNLSCDPFDKIKDSGIAKGSYFCSGGVTDPGVEGTQPTGGNNGDGSSSGSSGSGSDDKKNAAGRLSSMNSFAAIPAVALFAALFL